jgi:hypothetical protein
MRGIWLIALVGCSSPHAAAPDASPDAPVDAGPVITHPSNILGNGGFEQGLVGYGEFVQPDGDNSYGFFLSPSAHGGSYALELRCLQPMSCGVDQQHRAFVVTNPFHMPASQDYKLTFWAKCAAGADVLFYTESAATPYLSKPITCTGDWAQTEVAFTARAMDSEGSFYYFNRSTGSLFVDDAVLTYADGTVPVHTLNHGGARDVHVDGQTLVSGGTPFYALGFLNVPYDELDQVAAIQGANVVMTAGGTELLDVFNTDREPYPDRAFELGLAVVPNFTETARLGVPDVFTNLPAAFAHQANLGFFLADEPDLDHYQYSLIDPTVMQAELAALHTHSAAPVIADLQHAHYDPPAVDQPYQASEDVYGSEPYQEDVSGITQTFAVFGTMTSRPVWIYDDNHADVTTVVPKAYYGTILGATGLAYFTWTGLDAANRAADAQAIGELSKLTPVIFAPDATASVTIDHGIAFIARSSGGKTYVLAVNPTTAEVDATITATGASVVDVMFENRTITSTGAATASFTDHFAGISRHVYVF